MAMIDEALTRLDEAIVSSIDIEPLTSTWPDLDARVGHAIQDAGIANRVAKGDRVTGVKLGLTSRAKQERMGISTPITGVVTEQMVLREGETLAASVLIHPRVEPEIAFVMREDLTGQEQTAAEVLACVESVHACLEVIDSRFKNFSFTLGDVLADNTSAARYVVGSTSISARAVDLAFETCILKKNGAVVDSATGAAVEGHPAEAIARALPTLNERGLRIRAGNIVLTGGLTDAIDLAPGDLVTAEYGHLGTLDLRVE